VYRHTNKRSVRPTTRPRLTGDEGKPTLLAGSARGAQVPVPEAGMKQSSKDEGGIIANLPAPMSNQRQLVRAGYYGNIGSGKTTDLATMANLGPIVYVDSEAGLEKRPLVRRGINVDNIGPFTDITYDALDGLYWDVKAALDDNPLAFAGVCMDSMGEIVAKLVEQTNDAAVEKAIRKAERMGEDTTEINQFRIDRDSWGVVTEMIRRLFRKYRDLPCHLGWAALERRDVDDSDGTVVYGPKVNPGLQGDIAGYVAIVIHTFVDGDDAEGPLYTGHTRATGKYIAKDRLDALPTPKMHVPTFERLVQYVNDDLTPEKDAEGLPVDPIQRRYALEMLRRKAVRDAEALAKAKAEIDEASRPKARATTSNSKKGA
jgi:hypothetical protein